MSSAENIILKHAAELGQKCGNSPAASAFLTPEEQAELCFMADEPQRMFFWGGFIGAERRAAVFLPDWIDGPFPGGNDLRGPEREEYIKSLIFGDESGNAPLAELTRKITLCRAVGSGHKSLAHRDFLGALMNLGITRHSAGDICMISDHEAIIVISGKLSDFVCENLDRVGSDSVCVSILDDPESFRPERSFKEMSVTVSSMRLDCIASSLTGLSRNRIAEVIAAERVLVGGIPVKEPSARLAEGSVITIRGYGKFILADCAGVTKKDRIKLTFRCYA